MSAERNLFEDLAARTAELRQAVSDGAATLDQRVVEALDQVALLMNELDQRLRAIEAGRE